MTERKLAIVVKVPEGEEFKPLRLVAETGLNASISVPESQTITRIDTEGRHHTKEATPNKFGVIVVFPKQHPAVHAEAESKLKKHLKAKKYEVVRARHTASNEKHNFTKVVRQRI